MGPRLREDDSYGGRSTLPHYQLAPSAWLLRLPLKGGMIPKIHLWRVYNIFLTLCDQNSGIDFFEAVKHTGRHAKILP